MSRAWPTPTIFVTRISDGQIYVDVCKQVNRRLGGSFFFSFFGHCPLNISRTGVFSCCFVTTRDVFYGKGPGWGFDGFLMGH